MRRWFFGGGSGLLCTCAGAVVGLAGLKCLLFAVLMLGAIYFVILGLET